MRFPHRPLRRSAALLAPFLAACAAARDGAEPRSVAAPEAPAPSLDLAQRREVFEAAWSKIAELHFDPTLGGVDWKAAHDEAAPKVDAAASDEDFQAALNGMIEKLGHSHVQVLAPTEDDELLKPKKKSADAGEDGAGAPEEDEEEHGDGVVGMRVAAVEDAFVVTGVDPDSPPERAGVRTGDELLAVDGRNAVEFRERIRKRLKEHWEGYVPYAANAVLSGAVGSTVDVELGRGGEKLERKIERAAAKEPPVKFGLLGSLPAEFESKRLAGGVGYIRFNPCFAPQQEQVIEALKSMADAPGMVLDLRGNPGGSGAVAMGLTRHLVREAIDLGTMKTRRDSIRFFVNPDDQPYAGPLVVIVDGSTGSTAEILSGGLQAIGRARVVGRTSMGAALPSIFEKLPHGWRLQTVTADFRLPDGQLVEGKGVVPDVPVAPRRADFEGGRDPYVATAIRELGRAPTIASVTAKPRETAAASAPAERAPIEVSAEAADLLERMVEAAGGADAIRRRKTVKTVATMSVMGLEGKSVTHAAAPNRTHTVLDLAGVGRTVEVTDGEHAWSYSPVTGLLEAKGEELAVKLRMSRLDASLVWRELFAKVEIVERTREGDRDLIVVRQTPHPGEGEPATTWVDATTLRPARTETRVPSPLGTMTMRVDFLEFKEFDGLMEPVVSEMQAGTAKVKVTVESVETNVPVDESLFAKPDLKELEKPKKKKSKKSAAPESSEAASQPAGAGADR